MRNIIKKSLAVGTASATMLVGGAGMASASTGDTTETRVNEVAQVTDNTITDSGNLSLENILNGAVDISEVGSNNTVLSGIDADVTDVVGDIANGNDSAVTVDPDTTIDPTIDADTSADSTTDVGQDSQGLLGGLL